MESQTTNTETKQITIDVPADRLAEFYAFFGRFLAGGPGRGRRRPPGGHGRHGHHGHHCGHHRGEAAEAGRETEPASTGGGPGGTTDL
jgi:hypothetical protein